MTVLPKKLYKYLDPKRLDDALPKDKDKRPTLRLSPSSALNAMAFRCVSARACGGIDSAAAKHIDARQLPELVKGL